MAGETAVRGRYTEGERAASEKSRSRPHGHGGAELKKQEAGGSASRKNGGQQLPRSEKWLQGNLFDPLQAIRLCNRKYLSTL